MANVRFAGVPLKAILAKHDVDVEERTAHADGNDPRPPRDTREIGRGEVQAVAKDYEVLHNFRDRSLMSPP